MYKPGGWFKVIYGVPRGHSEVRGEGRQTGEDGKSRKKANKVKILEDES